MAGLRSEKFSRPVDVHVELVIYDDLDFDDNQVGVESLSKAAANLASYRPGILSSLLVERIMKRQRVICACDVIDVRCADDNTVGADRKIEVAEISKVIDDIFSHFRIERNEVIGNSYCVDIDEIGEHHYILFLELPANVHQQVNEWICVIVTNYKL